jgi:hypothetical protein
MKAIIFDIPDAHYRVAIYPANIVKVSETNREDLVNICLVNGECIAVAGNLEDIVQEIAANAE